LEFLSNSNNQSPNQMPGKMTQFVGGSTTLECQFCIPSEERYHERTLTAERNRPDAAAPRMRGRFCGAMRAQTRGTLGAR